MRVQDWLTAACGAAVLLSLRASGAWVEEEGGPLGNALLGWRGWLADAGHPHLVDGVLWQVARSLGWGALSVAHGALVAVGLAALGRALSPRVGPWVALAVVLWCVQPPIGWWLVLLRGYPLVFGLMACAAAALVRADGEVPDLALVALSIACLDNPLVVAALAPLVAWRLRWGRSEWGGSSRLAVVVAVVALLLALGLGLRALVFHDGAGIVPRAPPLYRWVAHGTLLGVLVAAGARLRGAPVAAAAVAHTSAIVALVLTGFLEDAPRMLLPAVPMMAATLALAARTVRWGTDALLGLVVLGSAVAPLGVLRRGPFAPRWPLHFADPTTARVLLAGGLVLALALAWRGHTARVRAALGVALSLATVAVWWDIAAVAAAEREVFAAAAAWHRDGAPYTDRMTAFVQCVRREGAAPWRPLDELAVVCDVDALVVGAGCAPGGRLVEVSRDVFGDGSLPCEGCAVVREVRSSRGSVLARELGCP